MDAAWSSRARAGPSAASGGRGAGPPPRVEGARGGVPQGRAAPACSPRAGPGSAASEAGVTVLRTGPGGIRRQLGPSQPAVVATTRRAAHPRDAGMDPAAGQRATRHRGGQQGPAGRAKARGRPHRHELRRRCLLAAGGAERARHRCLAPRSRSTARCALRGARLRGHQSRSRESGRRAMDAGGATGGGRLGRDAPARVPRHRGRSRRPTTPLWTHGITRATSSTPTASPTPR